MSVRDAMSVADVPGDGRGPENFVFVKNFLKNLVFNKTYGAKNLLKDRSARPSLLPSPSTNLGNPVLGMEIM